MNRREEIQMEITAVRLTGGVPEEVFTHWLSCLPGKRQAEILARRIRADQERSLCGELLARTMLARILHCPLPAVPISREERGKPFLRDGQDLFFNISHSGEYAVCAVSEYPVGIDIERLRKYNPNVARRVCSGAELALLAQSKDPARLFYRLWTLKESFVKLTGTGIGVPLQDISFSFAPDGTVISNQDNVLFQSFDLAEEYCLSVCERR